MHAACGGSGHTLQLGTTALVVCSTNVDPPGCDNPDQTLRLARFIQRTLCSGGGGDAPILAAQDVSPAPTECSRGVQPVTPSSRLLALDLGSLLHLRDWRKTAVLAPQRLRQDLAALDATGAPRLAALANLQDGLRNGTSVIVFDPDHWLRLLALGAPRVQCVRLPALMPVQDAPPSVDLLLIDHAGPTDPGLCGDLASALRQARPDLVVTQAATDGAPNAAARIHLHVGTPADAAAALRVMDSHAMQRPVIQFATRPKNVDPSLWVEPMQTGLSAQTVEATLEAVAWLDAHPVFVEVFRSHATHALEAFNAVAQEQLHAAVLSGGTA